jgi:hypothetical protein
MPKFATYQRPAPVNKQTWGGKPGVPYGKTPKQKVPKPAPDAGSGPLPGIKLPDLLRKP